MNAIAWDLLPVEATHDTVDELDAILRGRLLRTHFQPLFRTRDLTLLGWEALTRGPAGSPLELPSALFTLARRTGKLHQLDYACREAAISSFAKGRLASPTGKLFLNVEPTALIDGMRSGQTVEMLAAHQLMPTQVVIELTEASPHLSFDLLRAAVDHYRGQGFEIAIDDLGEGYASLRLWAEIRPDYIKIDRHFIHRAPIDPMSRRLLELMIGLSEQIGCTIIAEGVEKEHEWQLLAQMGVDAVQGFLLSHPDPELVTTLPEALRQSLQNKITPRNSAVANHTPTAATLAVLIPPVTTETDNETVFRRFLSDGHMSSPLFTRQKTGTQGAFKPRTVKETLSFTPSQRSLSVRSTSYPSVTPRTTRLLLQQPKPRRWPKKRAPALQRRESSLPTPSLSSGANRNAPVIKVSQALTKIVQGLTLEQTI